MRIRYIKLGKGGSWEEECLKPPHTLRLGFWTGEPEMLRACRTRDDTAVQNQLRLRRGKGDSDSVKDDFRQVQSVFWDDGSTVWITFHDRKLYWGRLDLARAPEPGVDERGEGFSVHYLAAPGWRCVTDGPNPKPLLKDDLAGHLGMVTQYRGTVCRPHDEDYVWRRIQGLHGLVAEDAVAAMSALERHIVAMLRQLTPADFEILVDMTFAAAGWRRQGVVGGTEEDVDLVLVRSSIGGVLDPMMEIEAERVAVQVKSLATTRIFNESALRLGAYSRAIFVYHTGDVRNDSHPNVQLVDAARLAPMVLDAGLTRWLLRRVR